MLTHCIPSRSLADVLHPEAACDVPACEDHAQFVCSEKRGLVVVWRCIAIAALDMDVACEV